MKGAASVQRGSIVFGNVGAKDSNELQGVQHAFPFEWGEPRSVVNKSDCTFR